MICWILSEVSLLREIHFDRNSEWPLSTGQQQEKDSKAKGEPRAESSHSIGWAVLSLPGHSLITPELDKQRRVVIAMEFMERSQSKSKAVSQNTDVGVGGNTSRIEQPEANWIFSGHGQGLWVDSHKEYYSLLVHWTMTLSFLTDQAQVELLKCITWQAKLCSEDLITGCNNQMKVVLICCV